MFLTEFDEPIEPETACKLKKLEIKADTAALSKLAALYAEIQAKTESLEKAVAKAEKLSGLDCAKNYKDAILPAMEKLRKCVDEAELITAKKDWPFPDYGDLLYYL